MDVDDYGGLDDTYVFIGSNVLLLAKHSARVRALLATRKISYLKTNYKLFVGDMRCGVGWRAILAILGRSWPRWRLLLIETSRGHDRDIQTFKIEEWNSYRLFNPNQ